MIIDVKTAIVMADMGLELSGKDALDWYDIARESHHDAWRMLSGGDAPEWLFALSSAASFNASPSSQCRILADYLETGSVDSFLPNSVDSFESFLRSGAMPSSKAECYRVAMLEGSRSDSVVVDRHMLRALAVSGELPYSSAPRGKNTVYNVATRRVLKAAKVLGISGCQCQAAIWYAQLASRGKLYGSEGLIDIVGELRSRELAVAA
jgi:hypothetical protein